MKVTRILHLRAPQMLIQYIGRREVTPEVLPDRASNFGGATIVLEGDTDKPGFVSMRVARCRFNDNYDRKKGITTAKAKDPEVVPLRKLAHQLRREEEHMLLSCCWPTRHDEELMDSCRSDYDYVVRHFLPLPQKEADSTKENLNG